VEAHKVLFEKSVMQDASGRGTRNQRDGALLARSRTLTVLSIPELD
jgi:hypothetical protein